MNDIGKCTLNCQIMKLDFYIYLIAGSLTCHRNVLAMNLRALKLYLFSPSMMRRIA